MSGTFLKNFFKPENAPVLVVLFIVIVTQGVLFAYVINDKRSPSTIPVETEKQTNNTVQSVADKPSEAAKEDPNGPHIEVTNADPKVAAIVQKVFKHMFLPSGNVRVETIVKPDELRKANPVFYELAKSGDHILFYSDRAILYDPVADRVLDVFHKAN